MVDRDELRRRAQLIQAQQLLSTRNARRIAKKIKPIDNVTAGDRTYGDKVKVDFPDGGTANAGLLFNASYSQGSVYPAVKRADGQWYLLNRSHQPIRVIDDEEIPEKVYRIRWLLVTKRNNALVLRIGGNTENPTEVLTLPFDPSDTYSPRYPATVAQGVRCYFAFKLDLTSEEEDGWVISYGVTTGSLLTIATQNTPWQNIRSVTLYKVTPAGSEIVLEETHQTVQNQQFWQYYPVGYGNWIKSSASVNQSGSGNAFVRAETHSDIMYFDNNQSTSTWTYSLYKSDPAQRYYKYGGNQLVLPQTTLQNIYANYKGESYSYEPPLISEDGTLSIGPHIRYQPYIPGVRDGDLRQGGKDGGNGRPPNSFTTFLYTYAYTLKAINQSPWSLVSPGINPGINSESNDQGPAGNGWDYSIEYYDYDYETEEYGTVVYKLTKSHTFTQSNPTPTNWPYPGIPSDDEPYTLVRVGNTYINNNGLRDPYPASPPGALFWDPGDPPPDDPIGGYVPEEDYTPGSTFYYWLWGREGFGGPNLYLYNPYFTTPAYSVPPTLNDLLYWLPHFAFTQPAPANIKIVPSVDSPLLYHSLEYTTTNALTSLFNTVELRPINTTAFPPPYYFTFYYPFFGVWVTPAGPIITRLADLYCVVRRPDGSRKGPYKVPDTPYGDTGEERRSYLISPSGNQFSTSRANPDNHYFYRKNHSLYSTGSYSINNAALTDLFGENAGSTISCPIDLLNPNGNWTKDVSLEDCFTFSIPAGETHIIAYDRDKVQVYYYPDAL